MEGDREMHKAICSDCGAECEVPFVPEEGKKVRCSDCFRKNRPMRRSFDGGGRRSFGGGNRDRFSRPREMHKAVCAECNSDCEVPFKPVEGKPVLCINCFKKKKQSSDSQDDF
jgi:CxxC-x17-CxxC domain-containing protein